MKKKVLIFLLIILIIALIIVNGIYFKNKITTNSSLSLSYPYIGIMKNNYITVSNGKTYSYLNTTTNKLITDLKYPITDSLKINEVPYLSNLYFQDGLAPITNNLNYFGLIDTKGNTIIEPQYSTIEVINRDLILVHLNGTYYFINQKNEKKLNQEFQYIEIIDKEQNIFIAKNEENYGVINEKGDTLLDFQYDNIIVINNKKNTNYLIFASNNQTKETYILKNNTLTKLEKCDNLLTELYSDDFIYYTDTTGKYYIYNIKEDQLITLKNHYIALGPYNNGLALAVNKEIKVGFIDENEQVIIPYQYNLELSSNFDEYGYAVVGENNYVGVIDTTGKEIIPTSYFSINTLTKENFLVTDEKEKTYIINQNNENITNDRYDNISIIENSPWLLTTKKDANNQEQYGIIDYNGKEIIEPKYLSVKAYDNYFQLQETKNKYIIKKI